MCSDKNVVETTTLKKKATPMKAERQQIRGGIKKRVWVLTLSKLIKEKNVFK